MYGSLRRKVGLVQRVFGVSKVRSSLYADSIRQVMQSYSKWCVFFIVVLVLFIAAFTPLIFYASEVLAMEDAIELKLDEEASKALIPAGTAAPVAAPSLWMW